MKPIALIIGFILLALGIAGFVPGLATDGVLFGLFPVSTGLCAAFIITGAIGIVMGLSRRRALAPTRASGPDLRDLGGV